MVDHPGVKVSFAGGMVRVPVFEVTTPCELVSIVAFKGPGAARLVACAVGMGAIACINVGPRAVKGANPDGMVSAACLAAGATPDGVCVPMHAAGHPMIAGATSSMPLSMTGVCQGVSSTAAGAGLEHASTHAPGAPRRADIADGPTQQKPAHPQVSRVGRGLADAGDKAGASGL